MKILKTKKRTVLSVVLALVFIVGSALVWALPMPAINVYYKVAVSSAELETKVQFHFDSTEMYKGSSTQETYIENDVASIRLDPLNANAKSLTITIAGDHPVVHSLKAEAQVTDDKWVEAGSIPRRQMKVAYENDGSTVTCHISGDQLQELNRKTRTHSLIKPVIQILYAALFLIVLLRITVCRKTKAPFYYGGALSVLMIMALMINVWVVKPSINSIVSPTTYSDLISVTSEEPFVLRQKVKLSSNEIRYIRFPVSITGNVKSDENSNPHYSEVYESSNEFVDRYVLSIRTCWNSKSIYSGVVTPKLLSDDLDAIIVPVHLKDCDNKNLAITLKKIEKRGVTGIAFRVGAPDKSSNYLSITTEPEQQQANSLDESYSNNVETKEYDGKALAITFLCKGFPYKTTISLIILTAVVLILVNLGVGRVRNRKLRTGLCLVNYSVLGIYVCGQSCFYRDYIGGFPDEQAHISYVAYLAANKDVEQIIPDFSLMRLYPKIASDSFDLAHPTQFNYLGHPPFFYHLLRLVCRPEIQGSVITVNINAMRWVSFLIALAGIMIACYIGFTRLPKNPILQLLYGLILISPPNLIYVSSGISNDSLTILCVALFMLGIVRFYEGRYNLLTYLIIASGICGSVLSKLTAGMIVGIIAILIVLFTLFKERKVQTIFNWQFLATLPIYAIPAYYFGKIYARFGSIQPNFKKLAEHEYVQSGFYRNIQLRDQMGVWEYICYYFQRFMSTWNTLAGHVSIPRSDTSFTSHMGMSSIALTAILICPLLVFVADKSREIYYLRMALIGVCAVFLYQLGSAFIGFNVNGYLGAFSSRYYLCAVPFLAITIICLIIKWFSMSLQTAEAIPCEEEKGTRISSIGEACCMVFAMLLIVDGFVYSVLMNLPQSTVFA